MTVELHIEGAIAKIREAAAEGLVLAAEHVLNVSNEHVPHEYGDLQGSGTVSTDPAELKAAVSYDTPYAARQHEEMDYRHNPGRTAKFLETAANSQAPVAGQIIASTIRSKIGS